MVLEVGSFGGASALPILVARETGLFARADVRVNHTRTTDSRRLREELTSGALDIVHLAPDNILAWDDEGPASVRAWLGGSAGPISLLARRAATVEELRGARIGVDSPRSGFAPILRQLLVAGGIEVTDVELVSLGATRLRYEALDEGTVDATMLTLPWSLLARSFGATILGDHTDVAPGLLTSCAASLSGWLAGNGTTANAYADALDAALGWLREPANAAEGSRLLAESMSIENDAARQVLATMLDPRRGWPSTSRLVGPELAATWSLRAEIMGAPASTAEHYVEVLPAA